jgi:predicted kinase
MSGEGPTVHLLCGLVGSGKSTYARALADRLPAVRFSLDEWMLRLYDERYDSPEYVSKLVPCKELIWDLALEVLRLGHDVVLDWNQWSRERRAEWRTRVERAGYRPVLHWIDVPLRVAIARTTARSDDHAHVIDEAGVRQHSEIFESPSDDEGLEIRRVSPR